MEAIKKIPNRTHVSLEELPLDVHFQILNFLPFKDSVRSLFRVSKTLSAIVLEALSKGKKKSLDCLITGMEGSGTTTLFWLLSQDKKALISKLSESQEQPEKPAFPLRKEGMQYVKRINIQEDRTAVIFHGSNKPTRRKQMFSYYGLTQCVTIVLSAVVPQEEAELAAYKSTIKELILPAYALCGHMNWIFAVNKMDLVEYSEKVFNDVSAIVLEICGRISNHIQQKVSFIPISALNSLNIFKDTKYSNDSPLSWFKGPSFLEKLNEVSMVIQMPVYKFFRRPSFIVIGTKEFVKTRKEKKKHPDDPFKIITGYVSDGFFDTTEQLYLQPNAYRHAGCKYDFSPRFGFNVETIKCFNTMQNFVTAGNFVGVGIHFDVKAQMPKPPRYQRNPALEWYECFKHVHRGEFLDFKPHYNRLSTTKDFVRVISAEAQLIVLGGRSIGKGTWNGELKQKFSAGFYAQGVKTLARIQNVLAVQDKTGRVLQDTPVAVKGQKATVRLVFRFPINLAVYDKKYTSDSYPNSDGRCLLAIEGRVIAVGVVTKVFDYDPKTAPRTYVIRKEYMW